MKTVPSSPPERTPTDLAPKRTKVPSMQVYVLSIALASLAASGPKAASSSRPSPVSHGRSTDGLLHQNPSLLKRLPRRRFLLLALCLLVAAVKRTRRLSSCLPRVRTATQASTSRCRVFLASRPPRLLLCPSRQALKALCPQSTSHVCYRHASPVLFCLLSWHIS